MELRRAAEYALEFLSRSHSEPIWLSLIGNTGVGKTHLAQEIKRTWRRLEIRKRCPNSASGWRVTRGKRQFFAWPYITNKIRQGDFGIIDYVCDEIDFLVIDDLGVGYQSELTTAKLGEIADRRLRKPTIITANLSLEEISDKLDPRIASRMIRGGSLVVDFQQTQDWSLRQ